MGTSRRLSRECGNWIEGSGSLLRLSPLSISQERLHMYGRHMLSRMQDFFLKALSTLSSVWTKIFLVWYSRPYIICTKKSYPASFAMIMHCLWLLPMPGTLSSLSYFCILAFPDPSAWGPIPCLPFSCRNIIHPLRLNYLGKLSPASFITDPNPRFLMYF